MPDCLLQVVIIPYCSQLTEKLSDSDFILKKYAFKRVISSVGERMSGWTGQALIYLSPPREEVWIGGAFVVLALVGRPTRTLIPVFVLIVKHIDVGSGSFPHFDPGFSLSYFIGS